MLSRGFFLRVCAIVFLSVALTACQSAEDQAQDHIERGLELVAEGDDDRARLEFRNALKLVPTDLQARRELAFLHIRTGNDGAALRELRILAEQDPSDAEVHLNLAEIAFRTGAMELFDRHAVLLAESDMDTPRSRVVDVAYRYRQAGIEEDADQRSAVLAQAEELRDEAPDSQLLRMILIDGFMKAGRLNDALAALDAAIAEAPENLRFYQAKAQINAQMNDLEALEGTFRKMVDVFPENEEVRVQYLRLLLSQGKSDAAESYLRELADAAGPDEVDDRLALVQFIVNLRGVEAGLEEIDRVIAAAPDTKLFQILRASLQFDSGQREDAIAALEQIIADAETAGEEADADVLEKAKLALSRMLISSGNEVGARRLVEETLEINPDAVEALKMQARWLIDEDKTDAAISALRRALAVAPRDVNALTLMAEAHQRSGSLNLMRDVLALAAESSNNAPEPTLRYAAALMQNDQPEQAEAQLISALRLQPDNILLLQNLGQLYLQTEDFPRLEQVIDSLERVDSEESRRIASVLKVSALARRNGTSDAITLLEGLANEDSGLNFALIRAYLSSGELDKARDAVEESLQEAPDDPALRYVSALVQMANGDLDDAQTTLRELTDDVPGASNAWIQRVRIAQSRQTPDSEVLALVDEAVEATNRSTDTLWLKASVLERRGNPEGAIAIYEELYEKDSSSIVVANNLASLLSTVRDDDESLERASRIASRLKDTESPYLQDTYGWIQYRNGNAEEALPYLEQAASALQGDPRVQYHLGVVYGALGRKDEAVAQLQLAMERAGPLADQKLVDEIQNKLTEVQVTTQDP